MQILLILAVIVAVSIAENVPHQPVANANLRIVLSFVAMAMAPLFALATSTFIAGSLERNQQSASLLLRRFAKLRKVHSLIWLLLAAVVLQQIGWVQIVRFNWSLGGTFLLDDLLIFMPVLLPLVLSWAAFYEVERSLTYQPNNPCDGLTNNVTRSQYLALHARHYLAILLAPVFAVLAMQDFVEWIRPAISEQLAACLLLLPIAGILLFFPVVLSKIWRTQPLENGELRERLIQFSRRNGLKLGQLFVWRTDRTMVNAAVAGLVRPWRYVFFTDALLTQFSSSEIETVLGHEIGHVRRHHLPERLLTLAMPVLLWCAFSQAFPQILPLASHWLMEFGLSEKLQTALIGPMGLVLYAATIFAAQSRLLEYEADLFAARSRDDQRQLQPEGCYEMACVLDKLATVGSMNRRARSWLHPAISKRICFLEQVAANIAVGQRFESRMRRRRLAMLLAVTAIGIYLASGSA